MSEERLTNLEARYAWLERHVGEQDRAMAELGRDLRRLQTLARRDDLLGDGVEFLGFVDDKRLEEELRTCRLLALPSRSEGFGLVFVEAMAHGRPCLGARSGGTPEVIADGETGILVEFGNVPAIAAGCIEGLQRQWDQSRILDRARQLSYPPFKDRLAGLLASPTVKK